MKKKLYIFCSIMLCLLLIAGCGTKQSEGKEEPEPSEEKDEADEKKDAKDEDEEVEDEADNEDEELIDGNEDEEDLPLSEDEADDEDQHDQKEIDQSLGDLNVFLGGEMIETEDKIIINGESNLLPGARVVGEVFIGNEEEAFADTSEIIQDDGSYYMEIDHERSNSKTTVNVRFHFDVPQDDSIIRYYGERGSKLEGPYVYQHQRAAGGRSPQDIYKQAMVTATFQSDEEMAVREFEEADWYDIPKDMGDPRVWLEVEDITDDGEFYYIHGRSNLIEGSKLHVSYAGKWEETLVLPDGSFDVKLEYEYKEDTAFEIKFNPDDLQWNIVEEVYGKEGQKLVGDLVETNDYNNKQFIFKEVKLNSTELNVPDNVELTVEGSEVTMLVPDDILFDFDEYKLKSKAKKTLIEIGKTLEQFDENVEIVINGHTDNVGNPSYNIELSENRAEEVKNFLMKQGDLKNSNFETKGHGETKPIASNEDEAGQAKNRRVEIVINLKQ